MLVLTSKVCFMEYKKTKEKRLVGGLIRIIIHEPFGLGRFATDRCYALQVNGRYAAVLLTLSTM